ncbi:TPA: helix-turn-helix transcriptional regulator [Staphylococcus aureus]
MEFSQRQERIIEIVKTKGPITGEQIADKLNLTRATLRPDLAILTMSGFLEARPRVGYYYSGKSKGKFFNEKLRQFEVKDYMSQPVVLRENTTVYDAICTIFLEDVSTLFIINEDNDFVGVCSRKDLLRASMIGTDIHKVPISVNMTRMPNVTYLEESELVIYAADRMIEKEIDSIPIVRKKDNQKYEVIGRISKTTIAKLLVALYKE